MLKVTFLGTSDQIPSSRRNHFSALITYNDENILVDCGEGTQRQFRKANLNPCKVTRIFITHWHADHVLGLPGLLSTLAASGYNNTLQIYCPKGVGKNILNMLKLFPFYREYKIDLKEVSSGIFFESEDFYLEACEMKHGVPCNAFSFVIKDKLRIDKEKLKKSGISPGPILASIKKGETVTFSGKKYSPKDLTYLEKGKKISFVLDTAFNSNISSFVKNSDLFVCESTYLDELKDQAKEHFHMTALQVGKIAKKSNVKKVAVVHISQRYEGKYDSVVSEVKKEYSGEVLAPKDLDSVLID
jgi:ribonuclease Z